MSERPPLPACRWAEPADSAALLALFARAFAAEMSATTWAWKYPVPQGHSMLVEREGHALAHYGGQPRRLLGMGSPLSAMQISDIMVDPAERGALGRNGLFARIARGFTSAVTRPRGPHAFVFGFPSPRASRLGETLGMYARLDTLEQRSWAASRGGQAPSLHHLSPQALRCLADGLWHRQAAALGPTHLIGVRDARWLDERYIGHPEAPYEALLQRGRWWRRPRAAAIYRDHGTALELIDLLGDPAGYGELIRGLTGLASERGRAELFGWMTTAVGRLLPPPEASQPLLHINLAGPDHESQASHYRHRCWMMAGDTDYR